jgi:CRISPR system Cascade subunit CasA
MPTFNLLEHCWIPCLRQGDTRPTELGINTLLLEAHQLREVLDSSPLVSAAIHRLLLSILHRALNGPASPIE